MRKQGGRHLLPPLLAVIAGCASNGDTFDQYLRDNGLTPATICNDWQQGISDAGSELNHIAALRSAALLTADDAAEAQSGIDQIIDWVHDHC